MIDHKKDEIWYWHTQIIEQMDSGLPAKKYCETKGIHYKKFSNMKYRITYSCKHDKEMYDKYVRYAQEFKQSGLPIGQFCKANKVDHYKLNEILTHLKYKKIIDNYIPEQEAPKMNFIQVPTVQEAVARPPVAIEAEVLKKQNDVELIISAGVKVVVAPEVGADKLIRIIELLKDL
jgi:hypothetical protein